MDTNLGLKREMMDALGSFNGLEDSDKRVSILHLSLLYSYLILLYRINKSYYGSFIIPETFTHV